VSSPFTHDHILSHRSDYCETCHVASSLTRGRVYLSVACPGLCRVCTHHCVQMLYTDSIFTMYYMQYMGAGVAQSVQCSTTNWTTGLSRFDPRERQKNFFSTVCVRNGCGSLPASCAMGTGGPFPGPGSDADHSPPSSAIKNE
jgi:hypothetical protein